MAKFDAFCQVASRFADVADFVMVYIEEAHPSNGWAFKNNIVISKHKTIEDRLAAAQLLRAQNPPFPVVVDAISDNANLAYGAFYERLYIIQKDQVVFAGGKGPRNYYVEHVEAWLNTYTGQQSTPTGQQAATPVHEQ